MIAFVFRSPKKEEMYLYLSDKEGFDALDDQLKRVFGTPEFVMVIDLAKRDKLARVDIERVRTELSANGFYLQLPPKPHNLEPQLDD
jgi:hypothetical protein